MSNFYEAILSWDDEHNRFVTLLTSGTPSAGQTGRSDYWSLSLDEAAMLGSDLLAKVAEARAAEGLPPAEAPAMANYVCDCGLTHATVVVPAVYPYSEDRQLQCTQCGTYVKSYPASPDPGKDE